MGKKVLIQDTVPKSVHPLFKSRFCYALSKTGVLFRSILEISLKKYGLVPPQAGILYILNGYGEYNQLLLGQEMSIDKASMVKFIDGLEDLGLVQRKTDPKDRRSKLLTLTTKGKNTQKKIFEEHSKLEEKMLQNFSADEIEALKKLMPRLLEAVLEHLK